MDTQTPPPVQAMDADPTVVDAAVRFCDDVLASPYVTLKSSSPHQHAPPVKPPGDCYDPTPYTVTLPITDSSGEKALSMIIEVPELYQWHGSIVTAEGVSVARMSNKSRPRAACGQDIFTEPVPIEWGGARFGEVNEAPDPCHPCVPRAYGNPGLFAHGHGDRIYLSMAESNPTKLKLCKAACWLLPLGIVPSFFVLLRMCCVPEEIAFRDGSGEEKVIGKRVMPAPCTDGCDLLRGSVLHFEDMTPEQRRLALVALMYNFAESPGVSRPVESGG